MDRRNFFKIVSTASTGIMTGACGKKVERYIPLLVSDQELVPGEEAWHPGICGECEAGCGIIARVMDGEQLTFSNEFDAVFSNAALHWMRRPDDVIAERGR